MKDYNLALLRPSWVRKIEVLHVDGVTVPGPCWIWHGCRDKRSGYGRVSVNKRCGYLHRVTYETFIGPIPSSLQIDHLCRQRACCAPHHLEAVTSKVNAERGLKGPVLTTQCSQGHEYSGSNLHIYAGAKGGPRRVCRQCRREYMADYAAKRKAQRQATWEKYMGTEAAS